MNLYQPTITGSLSVSGSVNISGSITIAGGGTISGTASYATNAELLDGLDSTVFTLTSSFAAQTASFTAFTASILAQTASLNSFSASVLSYTSSLNAKTSSFATTGSNTFAGIQTINSNLIVTGSITAQTLVVQTITSSVDFVTGSTRFGSILANTHVFTGSVYITGSVVGIGSPSFYNAKLNIQKSFTESQPNEQIRMQSTGGTVPSTWRFDVGANSGSFTITDNSVGERLTITSAGDVVINDTVANTYGKLQVSGQSSSNITLALANPAAAAADVGSNIWFLGTTGYTTQGVISAGWNAASNANAYMAFFTRGTSLSEKMRITSGGNVGIAISSPLAKLHVETSTATDGIYLSRSTSNKQTILLSADDGVGAYIAGNTTPAGNASQTDGAGRLILQGGSTEGFQFQTSYVTAGTAASWTTRMRITNAGNVLIGSTTDQGNWKAQVTGNMFIRGSVATSAASALYIDNSSGTELFLVRNDGFFRTGTAAGSPYNFTTANAANCLIDTDGALRRSTSSLKYKTDVRDYDKGLTKVLQLRPVYYKGKNDGDTQFAGLIAEDVHELGLTEFVQYAEDGTPDALHYQNMIALLTKSIQELKAEFDAYKATHP